MLRVEGNKQTDRHLRIIEMNTCCQCFLGIKLKNLLELYVCIGKLSSDTCADPLNFYSAARNNRSYFYDTVLAFLP